MSWLVYIGETWKEENKGISGYMQFLTLFLGGFHGIFCVHFHVVSLIHHSFIADIWEQDVPTAFLLVLMLPHPTSVWGPTTHSLPGKIPKTEFGGKERHLLFNDHIIYKNNYLNDYHYNYYIDSRPENNMRTKICTTEEGT